MKTETLIDILARGNEPIMARPRLSRYLVIGALGFGISASVSIWSLGSIPLWMYATAAPWIKIAYTATVAGVSGLLVEGLSRPGVRTASRSRCLEYVLCAIAWASVLEMTLTPAPERLPVMLGHSAIYCPWIVLLLSLPLFFPTARLVQENAPTRLRMTGFSVGVFAGSIAAMGYSLACTELSVTFVAIWYTGGIVLSGLVGALISPRLLAW